MANRLLILGLWCGACGACATIEEETDYSGWPEAHDYADIGPDSRPDTRPDGISLDVPLPDGYTAEVSETDGSCLRNSCSGCVRLRAEPGQPCGGCGGAYACDGPDAVVCVGGCSPVGCSDNTREAFVSPTRYPEIAGCAGGFSVPGVTGATPQCTLRAGNNSANPNGTGCSIADLCAEGWHPCGSPAEVQERTSAEGIPTDFPANSFFAAAVSGPVDDEVCGIGENDFYGLGTAGSSADRGTCTPLDRSSGEKCEDIPSPWQCEDSGVLWQYDEATRAVKPGPNGGGVLCCLAPG